mmetsp:Transcript_24574/g.71894  ORF Transcript_24574/g.71894 Transcript_24574/m.71894 type:complete len:295 (-) Transcript_24574:196-1080(-)
MTKEVWRFGYGSNLGLSTLRSKKSLNPSRYLVGTVKGWQLYFKPGIAHVEPAWAAIHPLKGNELHGSAFLIAEEEAEKLDKQEAGYNVMPFRFESYDGEVVEDVGMYVPKTPWKDGDPEGIPSLRYLRLLRSGAREAGLSHDWLERLDSFEHYVTPQEVRAETLKKITEFDADPAQKGKQWTSEELSKYNGSSPDFPPHVSVMGYVVQMTPGIRIFPSWKGHTITRRNILQFRGQSLDNNDIRWDQPGFRPLPKLEDLSEEEKEFVLQNLDSLIQKVGVIVARLREFLEDQQAR